MKVKESDLVALLVDMGVESAAEWKGTPTLEAKVNRDGGVARYEDPPGSYAGRHKDLLDSVKAAQEAGESLEVEAAPEKVSPAADKPAAPASKARTAGSAAAGKKAKASKGAKAGGTAVLAPPRKKAKAKKTKPSAPASKARLSAPTSKATKPSANGSANGNGKAPKIGTVAYSEWKKYHALHPMEITTRGPGIMRFVIDELKRAGKGANPKGLTRDELLDLVKAKFPDRDPAKMLVNLTNLVPGRLRTSYGIHCWYTRKDGAKCFFIKGDGREPMPAEAQK